MRIRFTLLAVPLLAALACADDPAPTGADDASALARRDGARVCHPADVVRSVTTLFPSEARGATLQRFQRARVLAEQGSADLARPDLVGLAGDVLARARAGTLLDPDGPTTANGGAAELADLLYACGGLEPVGEVLADVLANGVDVTIEPVLPDQPNKIVVPSAKFGIHDESGEFFDEAALVVLQKAPDGEAPPGFGPQYPPRYRVTVLPASAQTNFGAPVGESDPTILVIVCPADHAPVPLSELDILRVPDDYPASPAHLIGAQHVHDTEVNCGLGGGTESRVGANAGFGTRLFGSLRRAGAAALAWLGPTPLYAVDGGIGGKTRLLSEFVAVRPGRQVPTAGEDVVVINDMNVFDNVAMQDANNVRFVQNLVGYSTSGPRSGATRVLYDRGRNAPCFVVTSECANPAQAALDAVIAGAGYEISKVDVVQTYATVPSDVKVILLFNPTVAFTADDVEGLRTFAREGGRIVFLGEHVGFYGTNGIAVENGLLAALGAQMTNVGAAIECAYVDESGALRYPALGAASLRPHQTTSGMSGLTVACLSQVVLGPDDYGILYDATNTMVIAGVAKIDLTAPTLAQRSAAPAPNLRRSVAASVAQRPSVDGAGRPLPPQ